MTGFASPIFHRINASMLSLFSFVLPFFCLAMGMLKQGQHQCRAAGRFATEYLVQFIRLVPSTVCLAMGLLFFSAAGAMAWEPGPDNYIPVADAGPDRVVRPGAKVKLDGRNSITRRSGGLNYSWARTGGTPGASVALKRANRKRPKFVADRLVAGDDDVIHIFTLTVRDTSGTAATDTVTITVDAPEIQNFPPVANAGQDQRVASGVVVQLDGRNSSDNEGEIASWSWRRTGGTFGKSVIMTNANTARPRFIADILPAGADDVVHVFTLTVTDHDGAVDTDWVWVRVNAPEAPNLPPVANAGPDQVVVSGDTVTLNASRSSDREGPVSYLWEYSGGTGNGVSMKGTETWSIISFNTMILPPGAADITYNFTLTVTDNQGLTDTDTVTITATAPPFPAPVANAGPDLRVESGDRVTLDGTDSSGGNRSLNYAWARTGGTRGGTVTMTGANTALATFTADILTPGAEDVIHVFTLTVTDNVGASHADTIMITVEAPEVPNLPPVANAGQDQIVVSGTTVQLDGSNSSDTDGTIASWSWARTGGTRGGTVTMTGANTARPTFIADTLSPGARNITHVFTLRVTDSAGGIDTDMVTVTVDAPNLPPVANAGPDQSVASGDTVTLNGSGSSDTDGTIASWSWRRTGGTPGRSVVMTDANTARPHFTTDILFAGADDVIHGFTLTVTDNNGAINTDWIWITVKAPTSAPPPYAHAGLDQLVASGATVRLDGRNSTTYRNGDLKYSWERTSGTIGSSVELIHANKKRPTFTANTLVVGGTDVTHIFTLTVTDSSGATATDTVTITVDAPNARPVADPGSDRTVDSGERVTLDGRGTDVDGTIVEYSWSWWTPRQGCTVPLTISGYNSRQLSFTAHVLEPGDDNIVYCLFLRVVDNEDQNSFWKRVNITVNAPNAIPVANAGPDQTVTSGAIVTLDGTGSEDNDGTIASYTWLRTGGTGNVGVTLGGANTVLPSFTADILAPGADSVTHIFTLTVIDDSGESTTDTVTITVDAPNLPPVANAGPNQVVAYGTTVRLTGVGTDNDGEIASYSWARTGGTGGPVTLINANTAQASFTPNAMAIGASGETYTFTITITDDDGATATDIVTITVQSPFATPVANAGQDQSVYSGATVTLDGLGSTVDRRRNIVSYAWLRTGGTSNVGVTLIDANTALPSFITNTLAIGADNVTHVFTLTVSDDAGETDTDTVTITIVAPFAAPVADAGEYQSVLSGTKVTLDGSDSTVDPSRTIRSWSWTRTGGTGIDTVALTDANTARPNFIADTLTPGATNVFHVFTLKVTDSTGRTDTDTVTVLIESPFELPVASAGKDQVFNGYPYNMTILYLNGTRSTHDRRGHLTYAWARTGGIENHYVSLHDANKAKAYIHFDRAPKGNQDAVHEFTLTVTDHLGRTSTDTMTITRPSPARYVIAKAGDAQYVHSGSTVTLDGSRTNHRRQLRITSWAWEEITGSGHPVTLNNANTARPTFTADLLAPGDSPVIRSFSLTVTDRYGYTDTDTVRVTIVSPFENPVANAGPDQTVISGALVSLNGEGSTFDRRSTLHSYNWEQTDGTGSPVTLTNANTANPTFIADTLTPGAPDVTHIFILTVKDSTYNTSTDTVTITVQTPFAFPVADAGKDQSVPSGTKVTLDGNGSTVDSSRTIESWSWTRTGGTGVHAVSLTDANTAIPTFIANTLTPGAKNITHVFTLSVTDSAGETDTDTVTITVESPFAPTVAHAGNDQEVLSGTTVILDGSGSTTDYRSTGTTTNPHGVLKYAWARTGGTTGGSVTLNNASAERPVFTADSLDAGSNDVIHIFTLTVTDEVGGRDTDTVTITVEAPEAPNLPPVADAGPDQVVASGETHILDGSGSTDIDGLVTGYHWWRTGGNHAGWYMGTVNPPTSGPLWYIYGGETLKPGAADLIHEFNLRVIDDDGAWSEVDTVTITTISPFAAPVANAGSDRTVAAGMEVILDGTGSTVDRRRSIISYNWIRTGGTGGESIVLTGANTARLSFTNNALDAGADDVTHVFALTVTDNAGNSDTDTVTITVEAPEVPNLPPVANAGQDQIVVSGTTVQLDGSNSSDTDGTIASWSWTRTGGTGVHAVALTGANTARPTFIADTLSPGARNVTHAFTLRVTDSAGGINTDTVTITVESPFAPTVAHAGNDQEVLSGTTVILDGSGSTVDRHAMISYAWVRTGGTQNKTVALTDAATAQPSFTAETLNRGDADVTHIFTLTVTDDLDDSPADTDTVTVTVTAPQFGPLAANAGPDRNVVSGTQVTLEGSGTATGSGRVVTYAWTQTGGDAATVTLSDTTVLDPSFTAQALNRGDADVTYIFTLTVRDNKDTPEATDMVTITVTSPFAAPVANAGPDQTVPSGATVRLDGRGSTPGTGVTIAFYDWRSNWNNPVCAVPLPLIEPNSARPSFTAPTLKAGDADVIYCFSLQIEDTGEDGSDWDDVRVTVTAPPFPDLEAEAGPDRNVVSGTQVTLEGSGTATGSGRVVTYAWTQTGGDAATVTLSDTTVLDPSFTAQTLNPGDADVTYEFTLTVRDNTVRDNTVRDNRDNKDTPEATDMVTITVTSPFAAPVANAGDDQDDVASGTTVILDGSGSTVDRRAMISYAWVRTGGTSGASVLLNDASTALPRFTADTLVPGADDVTHVFTLTVTDEAGETGTDTVTITVVAPPFDNLIAIGGTNRLVDSGEVVLLDGTGSTLTGGGRVVTYLWTRTGGTGDSSVAPSNPTLLQTTFTAETLNPGDASVTHEFTLRVMDNKDSATPTYAVTFTVKAPNLPPVANAGPDLVVAPGEIFTLDGSRSTDNDGSIVSYRWWHIIYVSSSDSSKLLPLGNTSTINLTAETIEPGPYHKTYETYLLQVVDDDGVWSNLDAVRVTVTDPFEAPIANAGPDQVVASGATVTLDGSGSTHDHRRSVSYSWEQTDESGGSVSLTGASTATPGFTANTLAPGANDVVHVFTLTVTDEAGETGTDIVTITVVAPFAAPVANAGDDQSVLSGAEVTLDGSGSTHDHRRNISYSWEQTDKSGGSVPLTGASTATPGFTANTLAPGANDVVHVFTLTVTDEAGETDTDTVTVTVESPNQPPVANAGPDLVVAPGEIFTLDGSRSTDNDGSIVSYRWWHVTYVSSSDSSELLSLGNTPTINLTAKTIEPVPYHKTYETYLLQVVDDDGVWSDIDPVRVTVIEPFEVPIANAGPDQVVASGATVTLDGSGSTHDHRRSVSYSWEQTDESGGSVSLTGASTATPGFTANTLAPGANDVVHIFTLTVTDEAGETGTDTVTITVVAPFAAPVANAGDDRSVLSGAEVTLDGSGSIHDHRRSVSYSWEQTDGSGSLVLLTGANTATPGFTANTLAPGANNETYVFTLTVTDNAGVANTDTVRVTVFSPFEDPVANAGPDQTVISGASVSLNGEGSTFDRRSTLHSYNWEQMDGTVSPVTLINANTANPTFIADTLTPGAPDVTRIFILTIKDSTYNTSTDMVTITVQTPFAFPVANAGPDQEVDSGVIVFLDGSRSTTGHRSIGTTTDSDNILNYAWTRTGGTGDASVLLSNASTALPSFTADTLFPGADDVIHIFTLTVTNETGHSNTDTMTVTVQSPFVAPIADAGQDLTVASGAMVHLGGSGSTDRDGIITYSWARTGGTSSGASIVLNDASIALPSFIADTLFPGEDDVIHIFTLTVTNEAGHSDTDTMTVTVQSPFVAPVANAGPDQTVFPGTVVSLDGSGSTADFRARPNYAWTRTGGTVNVDVNLSDANTTQTDFTVAPLENGMKHATHVFTLTVTDNETGEISTDTVTITVESPLVANAGTDQLVLNGDIVVLDSSGSADRNGTIESYAWNRIGGTSTHVPSFSVFDPGTLIFKAEPLTGGDADVTHIFELTVTNNTGQTDTDTVTITVTSGFGAPVANAGDDQVVHSGEIVYLDASGSLGLNDDLMTYAWTNMNETEDSIILTGADTAQPSFKANMLDAGSPDVTHVFSLTVTNGAGVESEAETMTVTVMAPDVTEDVSETAQQAAAATKVDILVSAPEMTVQEGGSAAYRVKLGQSPGQKVMVEAFSAHKDITLEQQRFAFTAENWNEWQDVKVNTVADFDTEKDRAKIEHRFVTKGMTSGQSGTITVTLREIDPILSPVGDYLASRATALLNNQPGLSDFLKRDETTSDENNEFALHATNDRLTMNGGFIRNGTWGEITGSYTNSETGDTKSVLASFGVHRKFSENLLAGAMLQFDLGDHELPDQTGAIDGTGWLVGPYFATRHNSHPLHFEGRLLYGQSSNDIRFIDRNLGTRTGSFDTTRMLAQLRMEGEIALTDRENGSQLLPYVDAGWVEEKAAAFTDTTGNRVPGQKVSTGQLELGSNLRMPVAMNHGAMTLTGGLGVIWSNTKGQHITSDTQGRGRGEIGFSYDLNENVQIDFESFYDGIGTSDYESYGLSLRAEMKF